MFNPDNYRKEAKFTYDVEDLPHRPGSEKTLAREFRETAPKCRMITYDFDFNISTSLFHDENRTDVFPQVFDHTDESPTIFKILGDTYKGEVDSNGQVTVQLV